MASQHDGSGRSANENGTGARRKTRWPRGGPTKAERRRYEAVLRAMRQTILRSSQTLADEVLKGSGQDFSVDHMADHGSDNFEQDFSLSLLEGESDILRDIEDALEKLAGEGDTPYGLCETCAEDIEEGIEDAEAPESPWIPKGRLHAVPYARLCVAHKEREERAQG